MEQYQTWYNYRLAKIHVLPTSWPVTPCEQAWAFQLERMCGLCSRREYSRMSLPSSQPQVNQPADCWIHEQAQLGSARQFWLKLTQLPGWFLGPWTKIIIYCVPLKFCGCLLYNFTVANYNWFSPSSENTNFLCIQRHYTPIIIFTSPFIPFKNLGWSFILMSTL